MTKQNTDGIRHILGTTYYNKTAAAKALGISPTSVARHIKAQDLAVYRGSGEALIPEASLRDFVAKKTTGLKCHSGNRV